MFYIQGCQSSAFRRNSAFFFSLLLFKNYFLLFFQKSRFFPFPVRVYSVSSQSTNLFFPAMVWMLEYFDNNIPRRKWCGKYSAQATMIMGTERIHSLISVSVSAQDGIVALGKAHTHSALSLSSLPKVALETVPIFVWLNTDRSRPWRVECWPLPFSTPLSFRRSML